ncbi:hypothetical protein [Streptomyces sp. NPDC058671]|uniref:hypothetical protein n=1 Tax=Streptomyces sp. NPDC058671 TaxID=3346590 RepID=UPI003658E7DD
MDKLLNLAAGRPSRGKNPLSEDAGAEEWMVQLRRTVREVEVREQAPELVALSAVAPGIGSSADG